MTTNIIPMTRPLDDMDAMVRLCQTKQQAQRRAEKRRKAKHKLTALYASLVSVGAVFGFVLGVVIF